MSGTKDYIRVIIIALITAIASQLVGKAIARNEIIDNSVTKKELTETKKEIGDDIESAKKEAIIYTDSRIEEHEKVHDELKTQYTQIQSDLTIIKNHLINN